MTTPRKRLRRYEATHDIRFLTFSTYLRLPLFQNGRIKDRFAEHLAAAHAKFGFNLYAWVVMPEHVHLLLWPLIPDAPVSVALGELKREFGEEVIGRWRDLNARVLPRLRASDGSTRFWKRGGGYDRNIRSDEEFRKTFDYIHENPVTRGLVAKPTDWAWSSARWYSNDQSSPVTLDPLPPRRPIPRS